jgi:hypothetical protein
MSSLKKRKFKASYKFVMWVAIIQQFSIHFQSAVFFEALCYLTNFGDNHV